MILNLSFWTLVGTEPAIQTLDALKALFSMGLSAIAGPLVLGGLFFILRKNNK